MRIAIHRLNFFGLLTWVLWPSLALTCLDHFSQVALLGSRVILDFYSGTLGTSGRETDRPRFQRDFEALHKLLWRQRRLLRIATRMSLLRRQRRRRGDSTAFGRVTSGGVCSPLPQSQLIPAPGLHSISCHFFFNSLFRHAHIP